MLTDRDLSAAIGATAYDADGEKVGTVEHFFVDDATGAATWVALSAGLFGTRHPVAPAGQATFADGALRLAVGKDAVRHSPPVADPRRLDAGTEDELRRHYELPGAPSGNRPGDRREEETGGDGAPVGATAQARQSNGDTGGPTGSQSGDRDAAGRHSAPGSDSGWSPTATGVVPVGAVGERSDEPPGPVALTDAEVAAARGEEPVPGEERPRTERVPAARVRLVKYIVTEEVQITVPVRREEVRIVELPLTGGDDTGEGDGPDDESLLPPSGDPAGATTHELVLHAERPVVTVEVVPVERVRLSLGDAQVGQVQRERVLPDES